MPTIKINQKLNYDFEDYTYGDDFEFSMQFFKDDNFTIPDNVSTWDFFMDIKLAPGTCQNQGAQPAVETLSIGKGIEHDTDTSIINFSKKLTSFPGDYVQSIRSVEPVTLRTVTREEGALKIDAKL